MSDVDVLLRQARLFRQSGAGALAESYYKRAIERAPDNVEVLRLLASLYFERGAPSAAAPVLRRMIELQPDDAANHVNLGLALADGPEAEACYRRAIELQPEMGEAHKRLGHLLLMSGRQAEALPVLERALEAAPETERAVVLNNLAVALRDLNRLDEAADSFDRAFALEPNSSDHLMSAAAILEGAGRFDAAAERFFRVAQADPTNAQALRCAGMALRKACRPLEAIPYFERDLALNPNDNDSLYRLCDAHLLAGDYARAFELYAKWMRQSGFQYRELNRPTWNGEPIAGRRLLVYSDHGFGDAFQMMRFLPLVKERSGATVLFEAPSQLFPLVEEIANVDCVVERPKDRSAPLADYDYVIGLVFLLPLFGATLDAVSCDVPYLFPPPERIDYWRSRLTQTDGLRVGVCWAGDPDNAWNATRCCRLADFERNAAIPGVNLFSLQVGYGSEQLGDCPAGMSVVDLGMDFTETAAAMMSLDLIVSVDTAIAHLAGALGRPTILLLPKVTHWNWSTHPDSTPWYPTMKLIRQAAPGDWSGVFRRLEAEVAARVGQPASA